MSTTIPYLLHQTVADPAAVPPKVARNLRRHAGRYARQVYSDQDCEKFLRQHFPEYVSAFRRLRGAHKADLFRYAVLYVRGGVYMDIKLELVRPLEEIIDMKRRAIYTSLSGNPHPPPAYARAMYQSLIAAPPRQPLFLRLMEFVVAHVEQARAPEHYLLFTSDMYQKILDDTHASELHQGEHTSRRDPSLTYVLLQEVCTRRAADCPQGLDRYGLCCQVRAYGETQYMSRYVDYPW